jgi:hypothetical protein
MKHINPPSLSPPRGYSHVVEVSGGRTIYVSGQIALDRELTYERCDQENVIEQLGSGLAAWRMPVAEFDGNSAWLEIARLAWNLGKWIAQLALPDEVVRWEWKRFARRTSTPPQRSSAPAGRPSSGSPLRTAGTSRWSPRMCGSRRSQRQRFLHLEFADIPLGRSSSGPVCLHAAGSCRDDT